MKPIKIDITEKLRPVMKSIRRFSAATNRECRKIAQTICDIETGKLKIVVTVTKAKK